MLGAAGAMCSLALCTGAGLWARQRARDRFETVLAWTELLESMRLLLSQERLPMHELLWQSARMGRTTGAGAKPSERVRQAGQALADAPSLTVAQAYAEACARYPISCEAQEEKLALETLFSQLSSGTAAMREQAVAGCLRRLQMTEEKARQKAEQSGTLYARLGALGGLMLGIALW